MPSANDDFREFTLTKSGIGVTGPFTIALPVSPSVSWVIDDVSFHVYSGGPAATAYVGLLQIVDDAVATPVSIVWSFTTNAAAPLLNSTDAFIEGPVRITPGNNCTIQATVTAGTDTQLSWHLIIHGHVA